MNGMAVTADYVGSRGRDQTGLIDINEPRLLANGTIGRPGPSVFDPDGTLIPAQARNAAFQRVLEYRTDSVFNSDYDALRIVARQALLATGGRDARATRCRALATWRRRAPATSASSTSG